MGETRNPSNDTISVTVATESGRLRFEWIDDEGTVYATEAEITVA